MRVAQIESAQVLRQFHCPLGERHQAVAGKVQLGEVAHERKDLHHLRFYYQALVAQC
ncbi:hypothetical protein D3C76_1620670 [compost metagenome]